MRNNIGQIREIIIGKNVWVGKNVLILKNVFVGENSIIAAGSVVFKGEYPPSCISDGNPAKVIKN